MTFEAVWLFISGVKYSVALPLSTVSNLDCIFKSSKVVSKSFFFILSDNSVGC